jgi:NAD(P)-dependent dehydrogenase (short-subunit alcohol dehydrogenase family)
MAAGATTSPFDLTGHVAVVTGGTSGIGLGMAEGLARAGADVAVWGRDEARNARAREHLEAFGTRVLALRCDVSDPADVDAAFAATVDGLGRVDSCFANAGVAPDGTPFLDRTLEEFRRVIAINLEGAFLTLQGAARRMVAQGDGGSLVVTASLASLQGLPRGEQYAAAKAGVLGLVRTCAVELARHGIRANAILPGWIDTPMATWATVPAFLDKVLTRVPQRRWGTPEDFAGLAVYLASPASRYHTGDELLVDGGYRAF